MAEYLKNMSSEAVRRPASKTVDSSAIGLALTIVILWAFTTWTDVVVPVEVAGSVGVLVATGLAHILPKRYDR